MRVWHLAIPTQSCEFPTDFTDQHRCQDAFVLPRMSQICTDVRARCYPTEFAEFTEADCVCANLNISTSQHFTISPPQLLNTDTCN